MPVRSYTQPFQLSRNEIDQAVAPSTSSVSRSSRLLFFAGAVAVLGIAVRGWIALPFPQPFEPALPYQYTASIDPRFWLFLQQASHCIERQTEFAVIAPTIAQEHELYVLAIGAIAHAKPLPAAYFGYRQPRLVHRARYVAAFDGVAPPAGARETCRTSFGVVYENGS